MRRLGFGSLLASASIMLRLECFVGCGQHRSNPHHMIACGPSLYVAVRASSKNLNPDMWSNSSTHSSDLGKAVDVFPAGVQRPWRCRRRRPRSRGTSRRQAGRRRAGRRQTRPWSLGCERQAASWQFRFRSFRRARLTGPARSDDEVMSLTDPIRFLRIACYRSALCRCTSESICESVELVFWPVSFCGGLPDVTSSS